MSTLVITITTPDTDAMITDQLQGVGTITNSPNAQDRVARYIQGVANGAFSLSTFTTAVS
jgi:hypothetical protein